MNEKDKLAVLNYLKSRPRPVSSRAIRARCFPGVRRTCRIWQDLQALVQEGLVWKEVHGRAVPATYEITGRGRCIVEMEGQA